MVSGMQPQGVVCVPCNAMHALDGSAALCTRRLIASWFCLQQPRWWSWAVNTTLWKDMVANPHVNDADVVVVLVGGMDCAR